MEAQRLMGAFPVLQAWPGVDMDVVSELLGPGTALLLLLLLLLGAVASLCVRCSRPGKILGAVWGPFGDVHLWVHPEEAPKPLGLWRLQWGLGVRDKVLGGAVSKVEAFLYQGSLGSVLSIPFLSGCSFLLSPNTH